MQEDTRSGKMILKAIDTFFQTVDVLVYVCMLCVVLLQIFARVFLPKVPPWTEEMSRYLQVYLVAFGAGIAVRNDSFIGVDTLFNFVNKKTGILIKMFNNLVVFVLFVFFSRYSVDLYILGIPRTAVTMPLLTMNVIYFSMVLTGVSVLFYIVRKEIDLLREYRKEGEETC